MESEHATIAAAMGRFDTVDRQCLVLGHHFGRWIRLDAGAMELARCLEMLENRPGSTPDVLLWPVNHEQLDAMSAMANAIPQQRRIAVMLWLVDADLADAVMAADVGADGIVCEPIDAMVVRTCATQAVKRLERHMRLMRRCRRLEAVNRALRQRHDTLNEKVDILCNDLVRSNRVLAGQVQTITERHDFEQAIATELDGHVLLHRAMQVIRQQCRVTGAAVFLARTDSDLIDAHQSELWSSDHWEQIEQVEELLGRQAMAVMDRGGCRTTARQGPLGQGWTVASVPLMVSGAVLGVLMLYRDRQADFDASDMQRLQRYAQPLGRAIGQVDVAYDCAAEL